MKRNYMSGRQKRLAAEEKQRKHDKLLAKIPKLSSVFGSKNQNAADAESSPGPSAATETTTSGVGNTLSQCSSSSSSSSNRSTADQSPRKDENIQEEPAPSTDPALWDTKSDMHFLQSYWAKQGESS